MNTLGDPLYNQILQNCLQCKFLLFSLMKLINYIFDQIYVIDSSDRRRFDETAEELSELLNEDKLERGFLTSQ